MSQAETYDSKGVLLPVRGVFKTFGLSTVLKGIDLDADEGKVLVSIGGNSTEKSILMEIIMGIYQPDGGGLVITGEKTHPLKSSMILAEGVYMVSQGPVLFPNMTMEESVLTGFKEKTGTLGKRLLQTVDDIGWHLDLDRKAMSLPIAEQQLAELLRGLLRNARVLILGEPTGVLASDEVESLFKVVEDSKQKGIGVVYITHYLAEVPRIATHVAIMRDGTITLRGHASDFAREVLVRGLLLPNMDVASLRNGKGEKKILNYEGLKPVFKPQGYTGCGFEDVNLKVYPGEVLGVAGVAGAGHMELAITMFGRDEVLRGKAILDGRDITGCSTAQVLEAGINYMPEDRKLNELFATSNIATNTTSPSLRDKKMGGFFLNKKAEKEVADRYADDLRIKVTRQDQAAGGPLGGNQQKVTIGRSLSTNPKLVVPDEPTRGIGAAARGDAYSIIHELKTRSVTIMLVPSDMKGIVELSDRVVAVFSGWIKGELTGMEISQASLVVASFGMAEERKQMERHGSIGENNENP